MIRFNTLKNRWGYDVQAVNFLNEANAARASAANARSAARGARFSGLFGAATSILGTAGNIWASTPVNATAKSGAINVSAPASSAWTTVQPSFGAAWQPGMQRSFLSDWWR